MTVKKMGDIFHRGKCQTLSLSIAALLRKPLSLIGLPTCRRRDAIHLFFCVSSKRRTALVIKKEVLLNTRLIKTPLAKASFVN
jgi:hypothetical protein